MSKFDFNHIAYRYNVFTDFSERLQEIAKEYEDQEPELMELSISCNTTLDNLADCSEDSVIGAQNFINSMIGNHPQLTGIIPRELLWLLGGDCLHWMPDDEIDIFQEMEELCHKAQQANEAFDWPLTLQLLAKPDNTVQH